MLDLSAFFDEWIGGLQPVSRDTDNNAAMYIAGGRTKGANEKFFIFGHQHGYDVTWKPPIDLIMGRDLSIYW